MKLHALSTISCPDSCKIVDPETGKCLGVNETGELYMRGPR